MGRIAWVDTSKALGIFLVVLGHHKINPIFEIWIFSFHMPLFFFISGLLFDPSKYLNFNVFIMKRIRTLIVPYFFFALFSYVFWLTIVRHFSIHGQSLNMDPLKPFFGIFYGIGVEGWAVPLNTALWFLPCLFVTEVGFWMIINNSKRGSLVFMLLGVAALGFLTTLVKMPRLPWSIEVACIAMVYYGFGFLFKDLVNRWMSYQYFILSVGAFLALNIWLGSINGKIDMNENIYGNIVLFYLSGFSGILFLIGISKLIANKALFGYIGQNTLIILGLSGISFYLLRAFIYLHNRALPVTSHVPMGHAIMYCLLQILLLIPVIFLINKFFPFIIGRQKNNKPLV